MHRQLDLWWRWSRRPKLRSRTAVLCWGSTETVKRDGSVESFERIQKIADLQDRDVLEIGCGDGRVTVHLAGIPKRLVAIDLDKRQLAIARDLTSTACFQCGSGEKLAFKSDSFDVVLFTLSLHHQDSATALHEAHRVVRPDGVVVILEPDPKSEFERLSSLVRDETEPLERAQEAIAECDLVLDFSDSFDAEWFFDDKRELYSYLARDCGRELDAHLVARIAGFLQERVHSRPLPIRDGTLIQRLRKPQALHFDT